MPRKYKVTVVFDNAEDASWLAKCLAEARTGYGHGHSNMSPCTQGIFNATMKRAAAIQRNPPEASKTAPQTL
jgi:hypothetical protein